MTDYNRTGNPIQGSRGISKKIRDEFKLIEDSLDSKANIDSATLTGVVNVPTAPNGSSGTQVASLDFVNNAILQASLNNTLPGQTGNDYGMLRTVSSVLGWSDDYVRRLANSNLSAAINNSMATVAAHATNSNIWNALGNEIIFTGSVIVTDFPDAPQAGASRVLRLSGSCTFIQNSNLDIQGGVDFVAKSGDVVKVTAITTTTFFVELSGANFAVPKYLSVFSIETLTRHPLFNYAQLFDKSYAVGMNITDVLRAISSWVAVNSGTYSTVATSSDGETWTLRSLPSSGNWAIGNNGNIFLGCIRNSVNVIKSTDGGVTWQTITGPGANFYNSSKNVPVSRITNEFLFLATTSLVHITTDAGSNWSSVQSLPASINGNMSRIFSINNVYWYYSSGTTAYTSSTGLTGSWTARTLPSTPYQDYIWQINDSLYFSTGQLKADIYKSDDGINWTLISIGEFPRVTTTFPIFINGIGLEISGTGIFMKYANTIITLLGEPGPSRSQTIFNYVDGVCIIKNANSSVLKIDNNLKGYFI